MSRRDEIWRLNQLGADELSAAAQNRLLVLDDVDALDKHLARTIAEVVRAKPDAVLILPCLPLAPYPLLRDLANRKRIDFRRARLFFMTELCDASGGALPNFHPLSHRGAIMPILEQIEVDLKPMDENIFFPDPYNLEELPAAIKKAGGANVCLGSIGLNGHVGLNEPAAGVRDSTGRQVTLSDSTVTLLSILSEVGGDIENFPRQAFTLGMKECLSARKVRWYCRCEVPNLDWAKTVLRLAVLGQPGDDYPATWVRTHGDWQIVTDRASAAPPRHVL